MTNVRDDVTRTKVHGKGAFTADYSPVSSYDGNQVADGLVGGTICDLFQRTATVFAHEVALQTGDGAVRWTYREYRERVERAAAGLHGLGLRSGDSLALWMSNRPEFHVADMAAVHVGATPFSVYNTLALEQAIEVIGDSGARLLVTEHAYLDSALAVRNSETTSVELVVLVEGHDERAGVLSWSELEAASKDEFDFVASWQAVEPSMPVTMIYTSGTTGRPKGVQLSHRNIIANVRSMQSRLHFGERYRVISYLPMAHVAERLSSHYLPAVLAFEVTTTAVPQHAIDIVQRVRPNFFFSPPRLWEKMRAGLLVALEREGRRAEFDPVYARALQRTRREFAGESVRADDEPIEGEEVLAEMRRRLAFESLSFAMVGSAPCPPDVIEFFHSLGVRLVEVYGMTEEAGIATANPPNAVRLGTVGPPIPGVEVRLAVDGEVLIRGDNIMIGYRNMPDETAEAVDSEGWLHSGDIGAFDDDGYLKIVDRKKEIIISAAGKNMSPTHIEATLKAASPLIGQACVIGDAQPYNVALLTLEPAEASSLANRLGLSTAEELVEAPAVIDLVRQGVRDANEKLARVEQIKRFVVLASEWVPASDELTPTMKLKRRPIVEKYACEIEALYAGDAPACCV